MAKVAEPAQRMRSRRLVTPIPLLLPCSVLLRLERRQTFCVALGQEALRRGLLERRELLPVADAAQGLRRGDASVPCAKPRECLTHGRRLTPSTLTCAGADAGSEGQQKPRWAHRRSHAPRPARGGPAPHLAHRPGCPSCARRHRRAPAALEEPTLPLLLRRRALRLRRPRAGQRMRPCVLLRSAGVGAGATSGCGSCSGGQRLRRLEAA